MDFREFQPNDKKPKTIKQKRFQIKYTKMRMTEINRSQFGLLNCKRYYLTDGICSLPFGHFLFAAIRDKNKQIKNIHKKLMEIKDDLLREEFKAAAKCERISLLRSILAQPPTYYKLDSTKKSFHKKYFWKYTRLYIKWRLVMSYVYDEKFEGNILVVGRTGCGKTGFVQQLGVNNFFGDLIQVEWVSYVKLDKKREAQIQSCFNCQTDFYYPRNKDKFEYLLKQSLARNFLKKNRVMKPILLITKILVLEKTV